MKVKIVLAFLIFLVFNGCTGSTPINGYWTGLMEMNGKTVNISISINPEYSSFSSSDLMLLREPISNLKIKNEKISFFVVLDVEMLFEGTLVNNQISGNVKMQGGPPNMKIGFNLEKKSDSIPANSYSIEKLNVKSDDVILSAEIYKPNTKKLHPALILLHGATTNLKSQYNFYADFFANLGFEVLIFDKRGNGKSTGNYANAKYSDFVNDAIACVEKMKNRESVDKEEIGLWGHSQGASLIPLIIAKSDIPKYLIAKSPEVISISEAAAFSDSIRIINSGNTPSNASVAAESHRQVEKMIRNGNDYKEIENFINQNARNYSFMNQTGLYENIIINKNEFESYYWKGRIENFYPYWEKINIPTLVLFGEDDEFVNALKNEAILKSLNNKNIEIKLFPRANHNLKKSFNPIKYPDFDWPRVTDGYLNFVEKWLAVKIKK